MHILIELQAAQGKNREYGLGRYALAFALSVARNKGPHDVSIVLTDRWPEAIEALRGAFSGVLPQENIHVWSDLFDAASEPAGDLKNRHAEAQREAFLASLEPDIVVITDLFDGLVNDSVTTINRYSSLDTAVFLYESDLLWPKEHFSPDSAEFASRRLQELELRGAQVVLTTADYLKQGTGPFSISPRQNVVNISIAAEQSFRPRQMSESELKGLQTKYGLRQNFIMCSFGGEFHKRIDYVLRAFATLPPAIRAKHQLAIVDAIPPEERARLEAVAADMNLTPDEFVITSNEAKADLNDLYNACFCFVVSNVQGELGLGALEAMQSGKAMIAPDTFGLREIIHSDAALYRPGNDQALAQKLRQLLEDDAFRVGLERHGIAQAEKFSWDATAQRALGAFAHATENSSRRMAAPTPGSDRKRLAYISPLRPTTSGISYYSAELLPSLAYAYDIDLIVDQDDVDAAERELCCAVHPISWFLEHYHEYDRVMYHFGNSQFHKHMPNLLAIAPGVVVLHDFFLADMFASINDGELIQALKESHGYHAVLERLTSGNNAVWKYPVNLSIIQNALGIVVHSDTSRQLAAEWYGKGASVDWTVIPLLRLASKTDASAQEKARARLGIPRDTLLVCSFGIIGPTKLTHRIISAFLASRLGRDQKVSLVLVGKAPEGEYGNQLTKLIEHSSKSGVIEITGWTDADTFDDYLKACDIAVQLRAISRGETSAAVLDCMNYGLATIINAHGSMSEIDRGAVWMLKDEFEDDELREALERLADDRALRQAIGGKAQTVIRTRHRPADCAARYVQAIEYFYSRADNGVNGLLSSLAREAPLKTGVRSLAATLARNFPPKPRPRQLLVDVSALVVEDLQTGIQRVVRAILYEWLLNPPLGWTVEPVYATREMRGYRYARRFTCKFLHLDDSWAVDQGVDAWSGDLFIGLDLHRSVVNSQQSVLKEWRDAGVDVRFVVYDLLPVLRPDFFPAESGAGEHQKWLENIAQYDGAICISQAVARELAEWLAKRNIRRLRPYAIDWFHLGADLMESRPTLGVPPDADDMLRRMTRAPTFLMVGTIEPRKGYRQALGAFDALWANGTRANLIIVGKRGWNVSDLIARIESHPELGAQLHWLESATDAYLERIYKESSCVIVASEGEGFGLPLIEAAQHHLPIIARDIPVFREIAGAHASYFDGLEPDNLATAIKTWMALYREKKHVGSAGLTCISWKQSAQWLLQCLGIEQHTVAAERAELIAPKSDDLIS